MRSRGNLHLTVRPLRQVLYTHMRLQAEVREEFPVWNEAANATEWDVAMVSLDTGLASPTPQEA